ncbi:MAG: VWA domain-containing protein [Planctomycetes bacterium]|nr:VWA domain-containing protein [Planctomycetota bacterium]
MSLLYPLFLAGLAAVALPILLHMIRRHTRRRVAFSSLMFLRASLPRFRSRSRLEHVALLVLRCTVLCLLALAFARPYLLRPAAPGAAGASRRIVLLIDTSASMRRADLWTQAVNEARAVLRDAGPADRVCVMSFDQETRTLIGFEQWQTMAPGPRVSLAAQEVSRWSPGWSATDLGQALLTAAEAIEDDETNDAEQARANRQIVLVSDLQQGSKLDALLAYEWPQRTELVVRTLPCRGATNASLQLVTNRDSLAPSHDDDLPDIRITNSPDATSDRFQLRWVEAAAPRRGRPALEKQSQDSRAAQGQDASAASGPTLDVYVAAGHSTVVRAPVRPGGPAPAKLVLTGDDHDFDNSLYLLPERRRQVNILYLGSDDPNDTAGMLYYLRQAFGTGRALTSRIAARPGRATLSTADVDIAHLIVVTDPLSQANLAALRRYLESGKPCLLVMKSPETATVLAGLAGVGRIEAQEAEIDRYAMLGRVELDHPWLKPFSDPRFGDFTRIHFWRHRRVDPADCPEARVLARFDNRDPAWLEVPIGRGTLLVWTSGWHPADSDLALSSKFVPLLYGALEYGGTLAERPSQFFVGDPVPLPSRTSPATADLQIRKPDGTTVPIDKDQEVFTQTDLPGIYTIESLGGSVKAEGQARSVLVRAYEIASDDATTNALDTATPYHSQLFAVNLAAAESKTDPMPVEELEKLGVLLKPAVPVVSDVARHTARRHSFSDMESRQKLWRWVLAATLLIVLIETWLGGWLTRPNPVEARAAGPWEHGSEGHATEEPL